MSVLSAWAKRKLAKRQSRKLTDEILRTERELGQLENLTMQPLTVQIENDPKKSAKKATGDVVQLIAATLGGWLSTLLLTSLGVDLDPVLLTAGVAFTLKWLIKFIRDYTKARFMTVEQ